MCVFGPKSRSLVSAPPAVVLLFFTLVPVTIGQTSQVGIAVDSKGNVGIKTSSPTAVLDVNGRIRARKGADATSGVEYFDAADKIGFFAGLDTDGSWRVFGYKNRVGNAFVITESGSVTIGKASAPGDLSLKGNLYMDNIPTDYPWGTKNLLIAKSGRVYSQGKPSANDNDIQTLKKTVAALQADLLDATAALQDLKREIDEVRRLASSSAK